jgi:hypothetical protein
MITLLELWEKQNKKPGLRVRYADWSSVKYVEIEAVDQTGRLVIGTLDTGEIVRYPTTSLHFEVYTDGSEQIAQSV